MLLELVWLKWATLLSPPPNIKALFFIPFGYFHFPLSWKFYDVVFESTHESEKFNFFPQHTDKLLCLVSKNKRTLSLSLSHWKLNQNVDRLTITRGWDDNKESIDKKGKRQKIKIKCVHWCVYVRMCGARKREENFHPFERSKKEQIN
jgi:hypothetical protein